MRNVTSPPPVFCESRMSPGSSCEGSAGVEFEAPAQLAGAAPEFGERDLGAFLEDDSVGE
jgi:hypothetical protein